MYVYCVLYSSAYHVSIKDIKIPLKVVDQRPRVKTNTNDVNLRPRVTADLEVVEQRPMTNADLEVVNLRSRTNMDFEVVEQRSRVKVERLSQIIQQNSLFDVSSMDNKGGNKIFIEL